MRFSPYYSYGQPGSESGATNVVAAGLGEFIFDNYVPHGYAWHKFQYLEPKNPVVVSIIVALGCLGIHSVVNGQVSKIGQMAMLDYTKSYEGATQWEAAALASEHLKVIVPISVPQHFTLFYKNGSAEAKAKLCT